MGFRVLERVIGNPVDPVRFSFAYPRGCADARLHVVIVGWLLRRVCGVERDPGYDCTEDRFEVLIGTDEDRGKARIVRSADGAFQVTHAPRADTYMLRLGHVAEMPDDVMAKREAIIKWELLDGVLEVEFPAWIYEPRPEPLLLTHEPVKALPPPDRAPRLQAADVRLPTADEVRARQARLGLKRVR